MKDQRNTHIDRHGKQSETLNMKLLSPKERKRRTKATIITWVIHTWSVFTSLSSFMWTDYPAFDRKGGSSEEWTVYYVYHLHDLMFMRETRKSHFFNYISSPRDSGRKTNGEKSRFFSLLINDEVVKFLLIQMFVLSRLLYSPCSECSPFVLQSTIICKMFL